MARSPGARTSGADVARGLSLRGRPRVSVGLVLVAALGCGLAVWLLTRSHHSGRPTAAAIVGPTDVSEQALHGLARTLAMPLYWAGPAADTTYEVTESPDGRASVSYLRKSDPAGPSASDLAVGTYALANALSVTRRAAHQPGSIRLPAGHGGVAFYAASRPTNVYLAFPGSAYQIEVYDPAVASLRRLVRAGRIKSVNASTSAAPARSETTLAASPAALIKLSATLGRPVYWLGRISHLHYELTEDSDGRVYLRYLPAGVAAGAQQPYLTVAAYPFANALAATRAAGKHAGSKEIELAGGAVAFFSKQRPTNIYVAFPGVNEQIEIFDPSAQEAHRLVSAHRLRPLP
jgi:hypothetical protein